MLGAKFDFCLPLSRRDVSSPVESFERASQARLFQRMLAQMQAPFALVTFHTVHFAVGPCVSYVQDFTSNCPFGQFKHGVHF